MEEILKGLYTSWPVVGALACLGYQMHRYVLANETRLTLMEKNIEMLEKHDHPKEPCSP